MAKPTSDLFKYDKRVTARFVTTGKVSREEHEEFIKKLPDMAEHCEDIADQIFDAKHTSNEYVH